MKESDRTLFLLFHSEIYDWWSGISDYPYSCTQIHDRSVGYYYKIIYEPDLNQWQVQYVNYRSDPSNLFNAINDVVSNKVEGIDWCVQHWVKNYK